MESDCVFCLSHPETTAHLLMQCDFARECWRVLKGVQIPANILPKEWFELNMYVMDTSPFCIFLIVAWKIWGERKPRCGSRTDKLGGRLSSSSSSAIPSSMNSNLFQERSRSLKKSFLMPSLNIANPKSVLAAAKKAVSDMLAVRNRRNPTLSSKCSRSPARKDSVVAACNLAGTWMKVAPPPLRR
nr:uncharacterized protein LOC109155154 [Ipomoea batatas]GMC71552.1 uncharacterized protein LOC109155154 [Ipomoea batatas]